MSTEWLFYNIFRNLKVFLPPSDTYFSKTTYTLTQPKHREAAMPPLDTTTPPSLLFPFFQWTKQSQTSSVTAQGMVLAQPQAQLAVTGASSQGRGALGAALPPAQPWLCLSKNFFKAWSLGKFTVEKTPLQTSLLFTLPFDSHLQHPRQFLDIPQHYTWP